MPAQNKSVTQNKCALSSCLGQSAFVSTFFLRFFLRLCFHLQLLLNLHRNNGLALGMALDDMAERSGRLGQRVLSFDDRLYRARCDPLI